MATAAVAALGWLVTSASPPGALWPLPRNYTNGNQTPTVLASPSFFQLSSQCKTLSDAAVRYGKLTFPHDLGGTAAGTGITGLKVTVADDSEGYPQLGTDESYSLTVPTEGVAELTAKTVYGALRGMETFSQLVMLDFDGERYYAYGAPWQIDDAPRFPWRGLMIDTSRHFQTLASIRSVIDSLPYAKLNVLHWHMSDSQSFPMESKTHPKLWEGSWSAQERYLQSDIADIIEYARARGVRTMVEFDMPGHAGSWCKGYPEVCPSTSCTQPLNLASNATWDLITALLGEMTGANGGKALFEDHYIHLGGDEVNTNCWTKSSEISKWLSDRGMTADQGYAYFVKRAAEIALSQKRRPVQWVEVFDHFGTQLDNRTIVHVWKDKGTLAKVVAAGYDALLDNSPGSDSWYLDHLSVAWEAVYGNEPCSEISEQSQCDRVMGGQGEMWGETADMSDEEQTVWPRLGAIAERLWTPRDKTAQALASGDAHNRIQAFRCMLNRRGIRAAPVNNKDARSAPPGPGGCYVQ